MVREQMGTKGESDLLSIIISTLVRSRPIPKTGSNCTERQQLNLQLHIRVTISYDSQSQGQPNINNY